MVIICVYDTNDSNAVQKEVSEIFYLFIIIEELNLTFFNFTI